MRYILPKRYSRKKRKKIREKYIIKYIIMDKLSHMYEKLIKNGMVL
jgi:hypothetical protein